MTKPADRLRANTEVYPQRLDHPSLAAVKALWVRKRGTRTLPARSDIDAVDLKDHLGWMLLLDAIGDYEDFRFRLIGTKVTRYFFVEATGKTVTEAFAPFGPGVVNGVLAVYRKTARDGIPVRAFGDAGWLGRDYYDFDALHLPLSDDGLKANKVLCVFTFDYRRVAARAENALG